MQAKARGFLADYSKVYRAILALFKPGGFDVSNGGFDVSNGGFDVSNGGFEDSNVIRIG
nr:MAG TPA: hypothetical protein [Caudoviricetes sp.]